MSGTIQIWDFDNNSLKYTFSSNVPLTSLQDSVNGLMLSSRSDLTIEIIDVINNKINYVFDPSNGGHQGLVISVEASSTGLVATSSYDLTIKIWNVIFGKLKYTFDISQGSHSTEIFGFVWLNKGFLVSASIDNTIKTWNIFKGELINSYIQPYSSTSNNSNFAIIRLGNTKKIATLSRNSQVNIWNLVNGEVTDSFDFDQQEKIIDSYNNIVYLTNGYMVSSFKESIQVVSP